MKTLIKETNKLMAKGVYDPEKIFKIIYTKYPVHYARIREAIHNAKTQ